MIVALQRMFLLTLLFLVVGCTGRRPTALPVVVIPTATEVNSPTVFPTISPTLTVVPSSTLTPTPVPESRWQCDSSGGVACYETLTQVAMLNAEEGWTAGTQGMLLHYKLHPGHTIPTWQYVKPLSTATFDALYPLGPDELWGIQGSLIIRYHQGIPQIVPAPYGRYFDLAMLNSAEGWAVGADGAILYYTEAQGEWKNVPSPTENSLIAIDMLNSEEGWAVGMEGTVLHYQDQQWKLESVVLDGAKPPDLIDIEMISSDEGWAVGDGMLHYKNGLWQAVSVNYIESLESNTQEDSQKFCSRSWSPDCIRLEAISMINADEGWAVGWQTLLHYQEGQWQQVESPTENYLYSIDMVNAEGGWAVGKYSTVLQYRDGVWEVVSAATLMPSLSDLAWLDNGEGWAVGAAGAILHYVSGTWQPAISPTDTKLNAVDMIDSNEGWSVGWDGTILHYAQDVWQSVSSPATQDLKDVDMMSEGEGWAVGQGGAIIHYVNGEWQQIESPTDQILLALDMVSENEGWAVGYGSTILHYREGNWKSIEPPVDTVFIKIDMINNAEGWILGVKEGGGTDRTILQYTNNTWQEFDDHPQGYSLSAMDMLSADEGWFIAKEGILYYQGGEWKIFDNPAGVGAAIVMLDENEGWAVGGNGILHYTNEQ